MKSLNFPIEYLIILHFYFFSDNNLDLCSILQGIGNVSDQDQKQFPYPFVLSFKKNLFDASSTYLSYF